MLNAVIKFKATLILSYLRNPRSFSYDCYKVNKWKYLAGNKYTKQFPRTIQL